MTIPNLTPGWSCTYSVKALCGAPNFRMRTNDDLTYLADVAILEYDEVNYVPPLGEDSYKFIEVYEVDP